MNAPAIPGAGLLRRRSASAVPGVEDLRSRVDALRAAIELGGERLDPAAVAAAAPVLDRAEQRLRLGADRTVVALAGATGSGKSSLFNALCGVELSQVGARRPTTSKPSACVWGATDADELLDWLEVPQRHRSERRTTREDDRELDGLVLLDLPDHDSTEAANRLEVDRLVALVDLLVWVVDPQKYADDALHNGYLRHLSGHSDVVLLVLNQADRLSEHDAEATRADLQRLLREDGLDGVPVHLTSARTGAGVAELRSRLADAVEARAAALARTAADLEDVRARLAEGVAGSGPGAAPPPTPEDVPGAEPLVHALAVAAGVPAVLDAVEADHRRRAQGRTGWVPTRWTRRLRREPLRRLGLAPQTEDGSGATPAAPVAVSSVPAPTPAQRAQVDLAGRAVAEGASRGLPPRWVASVRRAAAPPTEDVADALDRAVVGVELPRRSPAWWRVADVVQSLLALAALVGALWLVAIGVLAWLQLPALPTWHVGPRTTDGDRLLPLPTTLLVGGLLVGLLLAVVSARLAAIGARRVRRRAAQALDAAVREAAADAVLAPVADVLADHARVRELLTTQAAGRPAGRRSARDGGGARGH